MPRFGDLREWWCYATPTGVISRDFKFIASHKSGSPPMSHSLADAPGALPAAKGAGDAPVKAGFWALTLGCIGVVYGDIGTSPLYALRESILAATGGAASSVNQAVVLGILSLIIWALLLIVTAKYILILLRADNHGEGG